MLYSEEALRALWVRIGCNLAKARVKRELNVADLASLSGVSEDKLNCYELGKDEISLDDLLRLSCALDVPLTRMLEGPWDEFFLRAPRFAGDFIRDQPPMQVREDL